MINHWLEYVGIGMNWALGSGCQIPQAAATYLQSWGELAGAVAVIWLPGAEMLHFTMRNANDTKIFGLQWLPSINAYGLLM